MQKIIIADASCLIVLRNIGVFDLLQQIYTEITITDIVAKEFGLPLPGWIIIQAVKDPTKVNK